MSNCKRNLEFVKWELNKIEKDEVFSWFKDLMVKLIVSKTMASAIFKLETSLLFLEVMLHDLLNVALMQHIC